MKVLREYVEDGVPVKVYEPKNKNRQTRTWKPFAKYSVANRGHQDASLGKIKNVVVV